MKFMLQRYINGRWYKVGRLFDSMEEAVEFAKKGSTRIDVRYQFRIKNEEGVVVDYFDCQAGELYPGTGPPTSGYPLLSGHASGKTNGARRFMVWCLVKRGKRAFARTYRVLAASKEDATVKIEAVIKASGEELVEIVKIKEVM